MTMKLPTRLFAIVALFAALLPLPALAAKCGLATVNGGSANASYDPFNPSSSTITITGFQLSRVNGAGGEKTSSINFYVRGQTANQNGTTLQVTNATAAQGGPGQGLNQNIFANLSGPFPSPLNNQSPPPSGIFRWDFGGNNDARDVVTMNLVITLPSNLNLTASQQLNFDIIYSCAGTGAGNFTETGTFPGAISANVTVQAALRASFAGGLVGATPALAFGEIGNEVAGGKLTPANNYIRVQATAPYKVNLTSAGAFRMTPGGTATVNANERIGYNLKFLGITKAAGTVNGIADKLCNRPGVGDNLEDKLYIQAQLAEAGAGKAPSTNYFDTLTVSIEPLAIPASDPGFVCGGVTNGQF